jgi:hypothetical protein
MRSKNRASYAAISHRVRLYVLTGFLVAGMSPWASGKSDLYRVAWRDDPATSAVICWNQVSGENPELFYGREDHGTNTVAYEKCVPPTHTNLYREMNNHFVRLEKLNPDTAYYFVICDTEGVGRRLWFKTAPATPQPFTFISGGDSRNNPAARRDGNKLVAKLRPLFVLFGGDYTGSGKPSEWKSWLSDWQSTISEDGRIYPIIATHGNHENADMQMMEKIFDTPHPDQYFSLGIGGDMMRVWCLNSELEYIQPEKAQEQNAWIKADLEKYPDVNWKIVAYHRPMRAHTSRKREGVNRIKWWAQLFYDQGVDVVVESDTHMVKQSYPVRPFDGKGSYESFIRDDDKGSIFLGEGSWGAPRRPPDDDKPWTMASASFYQFKWIQAFPDEMLVRTVQFENADAVTPLSEDNLFDEPEGIAFWKPESGKVLRLPFDVEHLTYTAPAPARTVLEPGSEWEWSLDGTNWMKAVAPFGYGAAGVKTDISENGSKPGRVLFRRTFMVESKGKVSRLFFDTMFDDGFVLKLNNKQLLSRNMRRGKLTQQSMAQDAITGWRENTALPLPVDPKFLKTGTNVVEVWVYNSPEDSDDLIFDMGVRIKP